MLSLLALWLGTMAAGWAQTWRSNLPSPTPALNGPTFIALDEARGFIYVSEHGNIDGTGGGRILKYRIAGGAPTTIAGRASSANNPEDGRFISPDAIIVDGPTGDLWIADRYLNRIQRITNTGGFVMKFGSGTPGSLTEMHGPLGLAIDGAGALYVTEHGDTNGTIVDKDKVAKYTINGTPGPGATITRNWRVGGSGTGNGQFITPYGIAISGNTAYVSDGFNSGSRLQLLNTANGAYRDQIWMGTAGGHVIPLGLFIDTADTLWIAKSSGNDGTGFLQEIEPRTLAGQPTLTPFGRRGSGNGEFSLPFHFVLNNARTRAYVADYMNDRVQVFDMPGVPIEPDPSPSDRLINLSSRLRVVAGDASHAVIAGFVITGPNSKQVLIRAVGPGLGSVGVTGTLGNPRLQIYRGATLVMENEDWANNAEVSATGQRVGAFPLAANSSDAAVVTTLEPGAYTAVIQANGGSGVALIEVYDTETASSLTAQHLINISTRGFVDTGDGQLIAGFVVSGGASKRFLIRGIGPALAPFGLAGNVADPQLRVFAANGATLVAQNDNWSTPQSVASGPPAASAAEINEASRVTGAFPLPNGSRDAAVVVTLKPGQYSAVVNGAGDGTGAGLVEVYELPDL
ncbi:MAG: NHL repeat-containing protein [Verrucomicrobiota bacterium]